MSYTPKSTVSSPSVDVKETYSLSLKGLKCLPSVFPFFNKSENTVMRLSKPSFETTLPIYYDLEDITGGVSSNKTNGLGTFGLSELLTLPHTFG